MFWEGVDWDKEVETRDSVGVFKEELRVYSRLRFKGFNKRPQTHKKRERGV